VRALTWVRRHADDNGYARPVANLLTVVDLNAMQVVKVEDGPVVTLPPEDANYSPEVAGVRTDLKPIEIRVGGTLKFKGRLGTRSDHWAVEITEALPSSSNS